ncbi:MAG: hypothetical protein B6247_03965 [Candidatus Parabeggiatoa sp. nov. 2]|nr:MAG: hypothetical protein B6247_03965 [Beggiatoa sp. 4572_84]
MTKFFNQEQKEQARLDYLAGNSCKEIANQLGCTTRTINYWAAKGNWKKQLKKTQKTAVQLEAQLSRLSEGEMTESKSRQIVMLSKALTQIKRTVPAQKPFQSPKPIAKNAISQDVLNQMLLPEYGLYPYQKTFLQSNARFIKVLKARQIGYSYGCLAPKALLRALAGRNQLIISASEYQSKIVLNYVKHHMEKLSLEANETSNRSVTVHGGGTITALPTNFRTIQGNPGDVILDEFAWYHQQKRIWEAIVPSITQIGGTVTVCSTPFVPGNLFWQIITEHKGKFSQFESYKITIHDAIEQGMPLPGGIEELRSLFDSDSWAMLYECQWAEDGSALLSWDLLHQIATTVETRFWEGSIYSGVDVGRTNDKFAIANVGTLNKKYQLLHLELFKNISFAEQRQHIEEVFKRYFVRRMTIDRTGLGMQLAEEVMNSHPGIAVGRHFSRGFKEKVALNLLKLCEDKRLAIYNDPALLTQLHAVKKRATATGITYDAEHDETGHADGFWALALAVEGLGRIEGGGVVVEIW